MKFVQEQILYRNQVITELMKIIPSHLVQKMLSEIPYLKDKTPKEVALMMIQDRHLEYFKKD